MKLPATFWKWTASSRFSTFTYSEALQVLGTEIVSGFSQQFMKVNEAACLALGSMLQVQQQHFRWILPCTKSSVGTRSNLALLPSCCGNSVSTAYKIYKSDSNLQKNVSKHGCASAILHSWWKAAKAVSIQSQSSLSHLSQWTCQRVRIGSTGPPLENCITWRFAAKMWFHVISMCGSMALLNLQGHGPGDLLSKIPRSPAWKIFWRIGLCEP